MSNILTCVYCGQEYPEVTPPYGAQILTDHIKICEKHPMREAEAKISKLSTALIGLLGELNKEGGIVCGVRTDEPDYDYSKIMNFEINETRRDELFRAWEELEEELIAPEKGLSHALRQVEKSARKWADDLSKEKSLK